jgi:hypothetical protein
MRHEFYAHDLIKMLQNHPGLCARNLKSFNYVTAPLGLTLNQLDWRENASFLAGVRSGCQPLAHKLR